jgi:hypothetical protein
MPFVRSCPVGLSERASSSGCGHLEILGSLGGQASVDTPVAGPQRGLTVSEVGSHAFCQAGRSCQGQAGGLAFLEIWG